MSYQCYIIDDEPIALDILSNYIGRLQALQVAGKFDNPVTAYEAIRSKCPDLLLLDINMPELSGLELIRALRNPPEIILTTAYRDFAPEGFDLDVVDYLLKPISFDRFLKAVDKFLARKERSAIHSSAAPKLIDDDTWIAVRADRKNIRVRLADILYLESMKDYVRIVTQDSLLMTKETISHFESVLPAGQFVRTHRSFLVAINRVTAHSADGLEVAEHLIPIGRLYRQAVERALPGLFPGQS